MQTVYRVYEGTREPHRLAVERTAEVLGRGGLALIPTETVYGVAVAVNAFSDAVPQDTSEFPSWPRDPQAAVNGAAVPALGTGYRRIFTLKQRKLTQTVAWLVDNAEALDRYGVDIPEEARVLARRCWPGALTIVVKAAPCVPTFMRAADDTVALRASASPVVQALIRACGSPLACTSANTHGAPAPAKFCHGGGAHPGGGRCCRRRRRDPVSRRLDHRVVPARRAPDPAPRRTSRIRDRTGPVRPDAIERCKRCR